MEIKNKTLYIVATPIGNLEDVSSRARQILAGVDHIYAEDTRVSRKLLNALEIDTPVSSLHQHSSVSDLQNVIKHINSDASVAYISDAGTPGISDPGGKLVELALQNNLIVSPIPGPSAIITALSVCGFPTDTFTFLGFPPVKKGRNTFFTSLDTYNHTVGFYESTHRIKKTIESLPEDRLLFVGRELTKMFETIYRGMKMEIIESLEKQSKGEFVVILAPKQYGK